MSQKARNIKAELVRRGIKIKDIAQLLGVTSQAVCQDIAGRRTTPRIQEAIDNALSQPVPGESPDDTGNEVAA